VTRRRIDYAIPHKGVINDLRIARLIGVLHTWNHIAMSIKDDDIDLSEIPESGGVTEWRRGDKRITCPKKKRMESAI
jgi:hypothetical protein